MSSRSSKHGFETLKASDSGRRLVSKQGRHEVQVKLLTTQEGDQYLIVRTWIGSKSPDGVGWSEPSQWSHVVLDDNQNIVAQGFGPRERDSWSMTERILKVKGVLPREPAADRASRFIWEPGDVTIHTEGEVRQMLGRDPDENVELMRRRAEEHRDHSPEPPAEESTPVVRRQPMRVEDVLPVVLRRTAAGMAHSSRESKGSGLEKDLQAILCLELDRCATAIEPHYELGEKSVNLGARWPKVGQADVALERREERILLELKWGEGNLRNCAWDLAKLGCALATGQASQAFLVAGAPAGNWNTALGSELFDEQSWPISHLRERYLKCWQFWEKDVPTTRPFELPSHIHTRAVARVRCEIAGEDWELRCCAVRLDGWRWTPWPSTLPDEAGLAETERHAT